MSMGGWENATAYVGGLVGLISAGHDSFMVMIANGKWMVSQQGFQPHIFGYC